MQQRTRTSGSSAGAAASPEAWSTNSDSPTPTNSVAERPWAKDTLWHGLLGDEHRQLLGTEEESSDRHSSDDDENVGELVTLYQITTEQREYYFKQFKAVQRDPNGLLSGQAARLFFEKSRIPVGELRHIWQLCDVTRDGALSLAEFIAAMHLVVLRRNNIPLPAVLPACLHPNVLQQAVQQLLPQEPPEADLLHLNDDDDENDHEDNADNTIIASNVAKVRPPVPSEKNMMNLSTISTTSQSSNHSRRENITTPPPLPPPVKQSSITNSPIVEKPIKMATPPAAAVNISGAAVTPSAIVSNASGSSGVNYIETYASRKKAKKLWSTEAPSTNWTKFSESPTTTTATTVSSPGLKPALFDMKRTAQDVGSNPQILHPVPLRVTPVAGTSSSGAVVGNGSAGNTDTADYHDNSTTLREASPKTIGTTASTTAAAVPAVATNAATTIVAAYHRDSLQSNDLRAIQRPQAKKLPAKNIGALPPPPQREPSIGANSSFDAAMPPLPQSLPVPAASSQSTTTAPTMLTELKNYVPVVYTATNNIRKEPPPLPPPRPHKHARSSSLDLNKFKMNIQQGNAGGAVGTQQPEITAQASFDLQTSTGFADFTQFPDDSGASLNVTDMTVEQQLHSLPHPSTSAEPSTTAPIRLSLQSNQRVSAFEIYRKPQTPRNSQSPQSMQQQPTQPPPPAPFGAVGAAAIAQPVPINVLPINTTTSAAMLPNAELFEKRINSISETLRHVSFKQNEAQTMPEILRHLREQNSLLLRLCNDLSDELLTVQTRKEELRLKLENLPIINNNNNHATDGLLPPVVRTGSSISAPVMANVTGGSAGSSSGGHINI